MKIVPTTFRTGSENSSSNKEGRKPILDRNTLYTELKSLIGLVKDSVHQNGTDDFPGELKSIYIDTLEKLIDSSIGSCLDQDNDFVYEKMIEVMAELGAYSQLLPFVEKFWDIVTASILDEIDKQEPGDFFDNLDSVSSAYRIFEKMVREMSKLESFHEKIIELVNNKSFYGVEGDTSREVNNLFRFTGKKEKLTDNAVSLDEKSIFQVCQERIGALLQNIGLPLVKSTSKKVSGILGIDRHNRLKPSDRELISRRSNLLFKMATGFFESGDTEAAINVYKEYFRLYKDFSDKDDFYISFRVGDISSILSEHEELFSFFEENIRKLPKNEERANALLGISEIHFSQFKNANKAISLLKEAAGNITYISIFDHLEKIVEVILIDGENKVPIPFIDEFFEIIDDLGDTSHLYFKAKLLSSIGPLFEKCGMGEKAEEIYKQAMKIADSLEIENRLDILIPLVRNNKVAGDPDALIQEGQTFISLQERCISSHCPTDRVAKILSKEFALQGDMDEIYRLVEMITKKISYPNDSIRDIYGEAIEGFAYTGNYDQMLVCIDKTPKNIQGSNVNRSVYSLIDLGNYEKALEFAGCRSSVGDANIVADSASDLIIRIMKRAEEKGDIEWIEKCLELLLDQKINEYNIRNIMDIFKKRKDIFSDKLIIDFFSHALENYSVWTSDSYFRTILQSLKKIGPLGFKELEKGT